MENSRTNNRILDEGGDSPRLHSVYQLYENNEMARREIGSLPENRLPPCPKSNVRKLNEILREPSEGEDIKDAKK